MDSLLSTIRDVLPPAAKEQLEQLAGSQSAALAGLPAELQTPEGLALLLGGLLLVVTLLLLTVIAASAGGKKKSRTVVITGPMNAGKTTLFYQLKDGQLKHELVASMQVRTVFDCWGGSSILCGCNSDPHSLIRML
jgi:hypothetical protein